jgi:1,5-anhydro-D-fructose reductase (1,5-anhydro-D-mannitol-forming)
MRIKWGVIGASGIARKRVIPEGILPSRNAETVALLGTRMETVRPVAEQFNVPRYYTRLDDFLADKDIQAVYIATPNNLHKEETVRCAEAGKHVLCEKPMAMNVAEGREMIAACRANGVKLGIALMMRFHAAHRLARDLVAQGKLGRILMARAQFGFSYPPRAGAWRQSLAQGGGGPVMDLAAHSLDVMEMIVGPISELTAQVDHLTYDYTSEDSATALFRFQNGAHGVTDVSFAIRAARNTLEIYGAEGGLWTQGTLGQGAAGELWVCLAGEQSYHRLDYTPVNTYLGEIEAFSDAILNNIRPPVDGEAGLHNMELLMAVYESGKTRQWVRIGE